MRLLKLEESGKLTRIKNSNDVINGGPILNEILDTVSEKAIVIVAGNTGYLYLIDEFMAQDELYGKTSNGLCFHAAQFRSIYGRRIPGEWICEKEVIRAVVIYHQKMMFGE